MEKTKNILIVAGEASGDLHAANLVKAIKSISPGINFFGLGGERLKQEGVKLYFNMVELAAVGLFDVLKNLKKFKGIFRGLIKEIETAKPDLAILVDYAGFNLRLSKELKKRGIPAIYYISPQVWASRRGRVKTIKECIDKILVIFKFEEEFYKNYGIDAHFVGHPLLDIIGPAVNRKEFLNDAGLSETAITVALLPGSRKQEIEYILPVMLKACIIIKNEIKDAQFVIAKPNEVAWDIYNEKIKSARLNAKVIEGKTYDCLNCADFCVVASGTATLETAIMQKPLVIVYKMNPLNYLLYRPLIRVPYIGIINILAKKIIAPEFIQRQATPEKISEKQPCPNKAPFGRKGR